MQNSENPANPTKPNPLSCFSCRDSHGLIPGRSTLTSKSYLKWERVERVRRNAGQLKRIPEAAIGPMRTGPAFRFNVFPHKQAKVRSGQLLNQTWFEHVNWVYQRANEVHPKGTLGITNWTENGRRTERDMVQAQRFYFDNDGAGDWRQLVRVFQAAGIPAIFQESAGSVARRQSGDTSLPSEWHFDTPLSKPISNPMHQFEPNSWEERYAKNEWKNKYRHLAGVFSALAGFNGVGGKCGFDLATEQMCSIRFLGCRSKEDGPPPQIVVVEGSNALDVEALLAATGYEPLPREDPSLRNTLSITVEATPGHKGEKSVRREEYSIKGWWQRLEHDIRDRLTMAQVLQITDGYTQPDSHNSDGASYTCTIPTHDDPSRRSLQTGPSNRWNGDHWYCHANCQDGGDVIKYVQLRLNLSRREARSWCARVVGLDPDAYSAKVKKPRKPAKAKLRLPKDEREKGSTEPVRLFQSKAEELEWQKKVAALDQPSWTPPAPLLNASNLAVQLAWQIPDPQRVTRAFAKLVFQGGLEVRLDKDGKPLEVATITPEQIASTLFLAMRHHYAKKAGDDPEAIFEAILGEVLSTIKRIQEGKPTIGRNWLLQHLGLVAIGVHGEFSEPTYQSGHWVLFQLANALKEDTGQWKRYPNYVRAIVGSSTTDPATRNYLHNLHTQFRLNPPENEWDKETCPEEHAGWAQRLKIIQNQLKRPTGCLCFHNEVTDEFGNNLGPPGKDGEPTALKRKIVCEAKACVYCNVTQVLAEFGMLLDMWKGRGKRKEEDGIRVVELRSIMHQRYLSTIKNEVTRASNHPKLGFVGWGNDGKPVLRYFVTDSVAEHMVESGLEAGMLNAYGAQYGIEPQITSRRLSGHEEAAALAAETKLSYHLHAKRLVDSKDPRRLIGWLDWSIRKSPVRNSRNPDALPYPTQDQVQEAVKTDDWEPELYEGQTVYYALVHSASGYVLAKRKDVPYTIDSAMLVADNHAGFQGHLRRMQEGVASLAA